MLSDQQPATRGDLRRLELSLRAEMSGLATKTDLAGFATKTDLAALAKMTLSIKDDLERKIEKLAVSMGTMRSDVLAACERAVFRAETVYRDQLLTHDRLGLVERRVDALEKKSSRRRPS